MSDEKTESFIGYSLDTLVQIDEGKRDSNSEIFAQVYALLAIAHGLKELNELIRRNGISVEIINK